ncbi:helix-turn-helix transcriptional regulator [Gordonibacter sp. An230]|uniref:helix-turn-helix transcriptional regulator n=1 Tax=Gordonibacter sp. An230 TaxID=1965592 RepID=UPI0013A5FB4F|nr:LuxR C-terminal-related transcriptional regulator [Gordonibacter sp. An230]
MTYLLFLYNIAISFASMYLCLTYLKLFRIEREKTFLCAAFLYLLYFIDIVVLYMVDFIPEFEETLAWLQTTAPYVYSSLSLAMLLCYRLVLSYAFDRPRPSREVAFWMCCLMATLVTWSIPSFAVSVFAEWVVSTILRVWVAASGVRMLARRPPCLQREPFLALALLLAVFVGCELADSCITLRGIGEGVYPLRRIPMEVLGIACLAAGFLYLKYRRILEMQAAEADLIPLVAQRYGLTRREEDMLRMMADGMTNRAIGEKEYISIGTVKTHAHNTYRKLGIAGRADLDAFLDRERKRISHPKPHDPFGF